MKIQKVMYGLPQAGILANKLLKKRLKKFEYLKCRTPPSYGIMSPALSHSPLLWTALA